MEQQKQHTTQIKKKIKYQIDDETTNSVRKLCARSAVVAVLAYLLLFIYFFSIVYHHSRWQKSTRKQSETEKISLLHFGCPFRKFCVCTCVWVCIIVFVQCTCKCIALCIVVCVCVYIAGQYRSRQIVDGVTSFDLKREEREKKRHNSYMKQ